MSTNKDQNIPGTVGFWTGNVFLCGLANDGQRLELLCPAGEVVGQERSHPRCSEVYTYPLWFSHRPETNAVNVIRQCSTTIKKKGTFLTLFCFASKVALKKFCKAVAVALSTQI